MKVAFDWGGTLENVEAVRMLARRLFDEGHEVHIIPATMDRVTHYEQMLMGAGVPWTGLHIVRGGDCEPEETGRRKAEKMKEIGCTVLYDDRQFNIDAVRAAGLDGVLVTPEWTEPA